MEVALGAGRWCFEVRLIGALSSRAVRVTGKRYDTGPEWLTIFEASLEGAGCVLVVTSRLRPRDTWRNHGVENGSCLKMVGDRLGRDEQTVLPARMRGERPMYARRWA